MNPRAAYARRQMRSSLRKEGTPITLRRITRTGGPAPAVNPPRVAGAMVDGAHSAFATTLSLRGAELVGRFLVGDGIALANGPVVYVSAPTIAAEDNTVVLPIAGQLGAAIADGAAASFFWAADNILHAKITPYPRQLIDGSMILPTDLRVRVAAMAIAAPPKPQDVLILETEEGAGTKLLTVIGYSPLAEDNVVIAYDIQARTA